MPSLLLRSRALRRWQARTRAAAFGEACLAARGEMEAVREHAAALERASGDDMAGQGSGGGVEGLAAWLGAGGG